MDHLDCGCCVVWIIWIHKYDCSLQNKCRTADPDRQNLRRSGKLSFFVIYKFCQNCAAVRQVLNLILKTVIAVFCGSLGCLIMIAAFCGSFGCMCMIAALCGSFGCMRMIAALCGSFGCLRMIAALCGSFGCLRMIAVLCGSLGCLIMIVALCGSFGLRI